MKLQPTQVQLAASRTVSKGAANASSLANEDTVNLSLPGDAAKNQTPEGVALSRGGGLIQKSKDLLREASDSIGSGLICGLAATAIDSSLGAAMAGIVGTVALSSVTSWCTSKDPTTRVFQTVLGALPATLRGGLAAFGAYVGTMSGQPMAGALLASTLTSAWFLNMDNYLKKNPSVLDSAGVSLSPGPGDQLTSTIPSLHSPTRDS
jgi:hypothetical protein